MVLQTLKSREFLFQGDGGISVAYALSDGLSARLLEVRPLEQSVRLKRTSMQFAIIKLYIYDRGRLQRSVLMGKYGLS